MFFHHSFIILCWASHTPLVLTSTNIAHMDWLPNQQRFILILLLLISRDELLFEPGLGVHSEAICHSWSNELWARDSLPHNWLCKRDRDASAIIDLIWPHSPIRPKTFYTDSKVFTFHRHPPMMSSFCTSTQTSCQEACHIVPWGMGLHDPWTLALCIRANFKRLFAGLSYPIQFQ